MTKFIEFLFVLIFVIFSDLIAYEYFFDRNSEKWKNMTVEERLQAMQIPDDTLESISTYELIDAYRKSRFTYFILAYNNIYDGFERVYNDFNGLRELLLRKDLVSELIIYYKEMEADVPLDIWNKDNKYEKVSSFMHIEILISNELVIKKATNEEMKEIILLLLSNYHKKLKYLKQYSYMNVQTSLIPVARFIYERGKTSGYTQQISEIQGIQNFIDGQRGIPAEYSKIVEIAEDFLRAK